MSLLIPQAELVQGTGTMSAAIVILLAAAEQE